MTEGVSAGSSGMGSNLDGPLEHLKAGSELQDIPVDPLQLQFSSLPSAGVPFVGTHLYAPQAVRPAVVSAPTLPEAPLFRPGGVGLLVGVSLGIGCMVFLASVGVLAPLPFILAVFGICVLLAFVCLVIVRATWPVRATLPPLRMWSSLPPCPHFGGRPVAKIHKPGPTLAPKVLQRALVAFQFLRSEGLSVEQAAGVVGNLVHESGVNPERHQDRGGPARGIAQWEGERWHSHLETGDWRVDLVHQLQHLWKELERSPRNGLPALRAAETVGEAAMVFCKKFERPGDPRLDKRKAYAREVFALFHDLPSPPAQYVRFPHLVVSKKPL